jgi:hypothetical protein
MVQLSRTAFERGKRFIESHGRPLEVARMRFHFDGAPAEDAIAELRAFQNADGGFGHALEPDLRAPESSALATSVAFQVLREIGVMDAEDVVSPAIDYIVATIDRSHLRWRIIPEEAGNSPHAPWWSQDGLEENFGSFALNPTAELLGCLLDYGKNLPSDLVPSLTDKIVERVTTLDKMEMHDFLCCKRLVEAVNLSAEVRSKLQYHLARLQPGIVATEPAQWEGYSLRPLQVADQPNGLFYEALQDVVPLNLDYEISKQQDVGSWPVVWSWGGAFPEVWEQAKVEWSGVLTLGTLLTLKRYGRIEGIA